MKNNNRSKISQRSEISLDTGRQLTLLRHCSRACGGILPRWFKV